MHDVLIVTAPLVAILAGILFNRSDMQILRGELKAEIKELRSEMNGRFDRVDAELRFFHGVTGKLDGQVQA
jgi:hypothetical protein